MQAKADIDHVQAQICQVKSDLTTVKKEMKKKTKMKKADADMTLKEQEFANEKLFEEIRAFKEKLTKLAN